MIRHSHLVQKGSPDDLRALGWRLAAHEYFLHEGSRRIFVLMTHVKTGHFVRSDAPTDADAFDGIRRQLRSGKAKA